MPQARSTLEALLVNDPEHPAIRHFILFTKAVLDSENCKGKEEVAIMVIREEMQMLEKKLMS